MSGRVRRVICWFAILSLSISVITAAQVQQGEGRITGRVYDVESGAALANANVVLQGTSFGASTSADGQFVIQSIPPGSYVVLASYVGYTRMKREVTVSGREVVAIDIGLHSTILPGQTIVITATRARERETPATFANLDATKIRELYSTQDIPQLLSELPSTTWYSENGNGIGYNYLNIRGFDQRRISVMINGIPQNDPEDHNVYWLDFPDFASNLQDVQVQRGAGSAFFGPPAIGGSVNLVTGFPQQSGIGLTGGVGSYNTKKFGVSVNSGLVGDRYLVYGRLSRLTSDGYRENAWTDFSSYFLGAVRFDETMTTQFHFYGGPIADHLAYYGIPKEEAYSTDQSVRRRNPITRPEEIENFSQPHYEVLHEWRLNEDVVLNNALFFVRGEGFFDYDGSWAPYSYYRITPENGFPVTGDPDAMYIPNALIHAFVDNRQYGWMPRVSLSHSGGDLTIGAELRIHRSVHWGSLRWGEGIPEGVTPDYHYYDYKGAKDIYSVYAQEVYRLRPDLTLLLHLQYVYNKYRLYDERYVGTDFTVPYHFLNPRVGLNYNLTETWNLYAHVSRTTREPRLKNLYDAAEASTPVSWGPVTPQFEVNPDGSPDFSKPLVKPESLVGVEFGAGYKSDRLKASVNLYYMSFDNEIVKSGQLDRFGQPVTGNAEQTLHQGIEMVGAVQLVRGLDLEANLTFSRNRFVRAVYEDTAQIKLDDNVIAGFPELLANARLTYRNGGFHTSISLQHVGEFYTDNFQQRGSADPRRTVDAYTVVNAWIGYTASLEPIGNDVEARLQINNIFDLAYASHGEGGDFFPAADRNIFASLRINL